MATSIVEKLEFDVVRELLADQCHFSIAAERAREIGPASNPNTVTYLLDVTRQAVEILDHYPRFGVGGVRDIRDFAHHASIGGVLNPSEFLQILDTVSAARALRRSFRNIEDRSERFPAFAEFVDFVADLPDLEATLARSISEHGEVLDSASEALGRIRRQLRTAQARASQRIQRFIQNPDYSLALQDPIVTSRDGRFVLPVRSDRRGQLQGVVHDTSSSGQTLFVEPVEMVELNNKVRELEAAEKHEIERILVSLSAQVGSSCDPLLETMDGMSAIDLAMGKARLASRLRASQPVLHTGKTREGRRIALVNARHPLLEPSEVVPIDVLLGDEFRILIVTGPNTGGKTVALKTVGLLSLMAQSGLYITADEGSELPVFDGVFADIGDEQSIEQSLSTFSSHMKQIIATLQAMTGESLVLFDELGAGTDPAEGAALARAIIMQLLETGCLAITTTHYSELKAFAYSTPGAENASVEFDIETLSPTYRLLTGVPGRSNAIAIASRLGMPAAILDYARKNMNPDDENVDQLIAEIQERNIAAEHAQIEAQRALDKAREAMAEAQTIQANAQRNAASQIEQDLSEAREYIKRVRGIPDRLPESQRIETIRDARVELNEAENLVRKFQRDRSISAPVSEQLAIGDQVELLGLGGEGEIASFSEDGMNVLVQVGSFKIQQRIGDVKKIRSRTERKSRPSAVSIPTPTRHVDMELHLRGHRAAGVENILEDYLNDAYLSHIPYVRIVHGKGTGALRDAVQRFIRGHPLVEKFETPPENEGGQGVTIAYLKES